MLLQGCKLTYFGIPGRGEASRIALALGGVKFMDDRISFSSWKDIKPTTPWGSVPILTLTDGTVIAQQRAILRLIGKETGTYPTDSLAAAKVDEIMDAVEDINSQTTKVGQGLDKEAKEAARKAACEEGGVLHALLTKVDKAIGANATSPFAVGNAITIADVFIYCNSSSFISGLFDGIPADALDSFDNIVKVRKAVRSDESICKFYDNLDSSIQMPASYGPL